ncbi:class I SAM-dependent methyltransferase [Paenibacillus tundrae]|uniref:class I SAM-dependent methyltransferase n=1 Tax=Paenibacillus tundrae TaxID=528187 RepID=UPI0022A9705D|nr:methyltransferase [Paenibacillus tundrae]MCZ1264761.1 methyltransferase domain-containing protein [Paenibacillus tundrae]
MDNKTLNFKTSDKVFSPKSIDKGTMEMISKVEFNSEDKVLDLGCGYGFVGIYASKIAGVEKVVMVDVQDKAIELAQQNIEINNITNATLIQSDGFKNMFETGFTIILSNPPYHVDFAVPKNFIEKGFNRLTVGGKMYMVTKRKEWYKKKFISIFGGVKIWEVDGYYIFMGIKNSMKYASK